jgi:putative peptide zinc metalloprotease protein
MVLEARPDVTTASQPVEPPRSSHAPRVAQGVELIGQYEGSGFKEAPYLARRADGQTIQLSKLLYAVAESCDGRRTYDEIAAEASRTFGRRLSARNAKTLVEEKLNPLGVVANHDGSQPVLSKPDSLLALKLRKGVIPPRAVRTLTTLFYPLFFPPVIVVALGALAVFDWWLFTHHGVAQGVRQTMLHPALFLAMFGFVVVSAFLHECGHATGCRYGGAEPGVMGAGIYLAFPAFFTDVTDAYRLSKGGRLRTDLGGVYFNALFMLGCAGAYAATRFEPLLFLILVQHIEIAHQFLPFLRLDGYYIVADAVGVPDLFTRIGPILKSMLPWKRSDQRVTALKPWVRFFVTAWVLVVVPFLLFNLTLILVHLPRLLATGAESLHQQTAAIAKAGNVVMKAAGVVQLVALLLPFFGIAYTLVRVAKRIGRRSWAWSADSVVKRSFVVLVGTGLVALLVWSWLPGKRYAPIGPDERGTFSDYVAASTTIVTRPGVEPAYVPAGDTSQAVVGDPVAPEPTIAPSAEVSTAPADTVPSTEPSAAVESPTPSPSDSPTAEPTESPSP